MSVRVSVVMPAWRPRPDWLRAAVASALDESACEIDLIVVDDGSEQPVAELLAELDDPRLRILRTEHRGPYAARDAGVAAAHGAFLRFVDADDIVEPGSTGRLLALAASGREAVSYGATLMCDEDLAPRRLVTCELEGDVAQACALGAFTVYHVAMLFPRPVVARAGRWDEAGFRVSGDWDFVLRALEQAPVRRLDEVVVRYRRHAASVSRLADVAAGAEAARAVLDRYFARHPEQRRSGFARRAYGRLHLDRASAHAAAGERLPALRQLGKGARHQPLAAGSLARRWAAARAVSVMSRAPTRGGRRPRRRA